jgi:hypothetical protein
MNEIEAMKKEITDIAQSLKRVNYILSTMSEPAAEAGAGGTNTQPVSTMCATTPAKPTYIAPEVRTVGGPKKLVSPPDGKKLDVNDLIDGLFTKETK